MLFIPPSGAPASLHLASHPRDRRARVGHPLHGSRTQKPKKGKDGPPVSIFRLVAKWERKRSLNRKRWERNHTTPIPCARRRRWLSRERAMVRPLCQVTWFKTGQEMATA